MPLSKWIPVFGCFLLGLKQWWNVEYKANHGDSYNTIMFTDLSEYTHLYWYHNTSSSQWKYHSVWRSGRVRDRWCLGWHFTFNKKVLRELSKDRNSLLICTNSISGNQMCLCVYWMKPWRSLKNSLHVMMLTDEAVLTFYVHKTQHLYWLTEY